jgi:uncharacterized protein YbaP (TraB family)
MTIAGLIILFISLNNKAKAVKIPAWVVSYQDHKVYLVGNIPFGKKSFFPLADKLEEIYKQCNTIVVLCDTRDDSRFQDIISSKGCSPSGLKNELSSKVYDNLLKFSKRYYCSAKVKDSYEQPWLAIWNIENSHPMILMEKAKMTDFLSQDLFTNELSTQRYFLNKLQGKRLIELEPVEEFVDILSKLSPNTYVSYAIKRLEIIFSNGESYYQTMRMGNCSKLTEWFMQPLTINPKYEEIYKNLYFKRSLKLLPKIISLLKKNKSTFIILDMELLIGNEGIINLLKKTNYTVERLK